MILHVSKICHEFEVPWYTFIFIFKLTYLPILKNIQPAQHKIKQVWPNLQLIHYSTLFMCLIKSTRNSGYLMIVRITIQLIEILLLIVEIDKKNYGYPKMCFTITFPSNTSHKSNGTKLLKEQSPQLHLSDYYIIHEGCLSTEVSQQCMPHLFRQQPLLLECS